jgi:hypothetical protein
MPTITVRDETATGRPEAEFALNLPTERIRVRELIRARVFQEVKDYNANQSGHFRGLVQPTDTEMTINGFKLRKRREIDAQAQYEKAIDAFSSNGFLVLVDDRQVTDLDEEIALAPSTEVAFVRLVPLVGG